MIREGELLFFFFAIGYSQYIFLMLIHIIIHWKWTKCMSDLNSFHRNCEMDLSVADTGPVPLFPF